MNLFDQFDEIFHTTERVFLPLANPFDDLDEKKFKEPSPLVGRFMSTITDCTIQKLINLTLSSLSLLPIALLGLIDK